MGLSAARDEILGRVRAALRDVPRDEGPEPPAYDPPTPAGGNPVALFAERVADYRATVREAGEEVAEAVAQVFAEQGAQRVVVAPGLPDAWRPAGVELVADDELSPRALDGLDGALTGCAVAIAQTGTIVLDGGERSGRRAVTLIPDLHVCVVQRAQVVASVPEAIRALEGGRGPFTFVSGPSATSDIELERVEGVHGPRRLVVLIAP